MPSLLSYLGLPMPEKPISPGRDFSPTLRGRKLENWDDVVFYEFENVRHVRTAEWKYVERLGQEPRVELFDLNADPEELNNLAGKDIHSRIQTRLQKRLHQWFEQHADPEWDLWKGGRSKTRVGTQEYIDHGIKQPPSPANSNPSE